MLLTKKNCRYSVVPKTNKCLEDINKFIKENHFDESGIIYCLSRMDCEKVAETLQVSRLFAFLVSLMEAFTYCERTSVLLHVLCSNLEVHVIFRGLAIKQPSTMAVWIQVNVLMYRNNGAKMKSI